MDLASCLPSGAYNFEFATTFLKNSFTLACVLCLTQNRRRELCFFSISGNVFVYCVSLVGKKSDTTPTVMQLNMWLCSAVAGSLFRSEAQ
jgi:hypothetical protein